MKNKTMISKKTKPLNKLREIASKREINIIRVESKIDGIICWAEYDPNVMPKLTIKEIASDLLKIRNQRQE